MGMVVAQATRPFIHTAHSPKPMNDAITEYHIGHLEAFVVSADEHLTAKHGHLKLRLATKRAAGTSTFCSPRNSRSDQ